MHQQEIDEVEALLSRVGEIDAKTIEAIMAKSEPVQISDTSGGIATIRIVGPMLPERSPVLSFFGKQHTAYSDILAGIIDAERAGAEKIIFEMDTPGGTVNGMHDVMEAVSGTKAETETHVKGVLASAGYSIGSQTDRISASNELNMIGSVGVVQDFRVRDDVVSVTNHESPDKVLDVTTENGKKKVADKLSDVYGIMAEKIAKGRKITIEDVNKNFGQGAVMTARTALSRGMIDSIGFNSEVNKPSAGASAATQTKEKDMDKAKLKAEFPELYAAIHAEGAEAGKAEALEVVKGHMDLLAMSGDSEKAMADIQALKPVTTSDMTHHLAVAQKNANIKDRGNEAPPAIPNGDPDAAHGGGDNDDKVLAKELGAIEGVDLMEV
jgi:ClpP class serine protease